MLNKFKIIYLLIKNKTNFIYLKAPTPEPKWLTEKERQIALVMLVFGSFSFSLALSPGLRGKLESMKA